MTQRALQVDKANLSRPLPRPWHRLHVSTLAVILLAGVVLFFLNVPGQEVAYVDLDGHGQYSSEFDIYYGLEHGWPVSFLDRDTYVAVANVPFGGYPTSAWSLGEAVSDFSPWLLVLDASIAVGTLLVLALAYEWWRRRKQRVFQFRLGHLFLLVSGICVLLAYFVWQWNEYRDEYECVAQLAKAENDFGADVVWLPGGPSWVRELWGEDFPPIFDRVIELSISADQIESARNFERLRSLRVDGYLTANQLSALSGLRELEAIDFSFGGIESNEVGIEEGDVVGEEPDGEFTRGMQQLRVLSKLRGLNLADTQVSNSALGAIADLPSLELIDLTGFSGTGIGDEGLWHLSKINSLQTIYLESSEVSDIGISYLARHKNLRNLTLRCYKVTDRSLNALAQLPQLRKLDLRGTSITAEGLFNLHDLQTVEQLAVPKELAGESERLKGAFPRATIWFSD